MTSTTRRRKDVTPMLKHRDISELSIGYLQLCGEFETLHVIIYYNTFVCNNFREDEFHEIGVLQRNSNLRSN